MDPIRSQRVGNGFHCVLRQVVVQQHVRVRIGDVILDATGSNAEIERDVDCADKLRREKNRCTLRSISHADGYPVAPLDT